MTLVTAVPWEKPRGSFLISSGTPWSRNSSSWAAASSGWSRSTPESMIPMVTPSPGSGTASVDDFEAGMGLVGVDPFQSLLFLIFRVGEVLLGDSVSPGLELSYRDAAMIGGLEAGTGRLGGRGGTAAH